MQKKCTRQFFLLCFMLVVGWLNVTAQQPDARTATDLVKKNITAIGWSAPDLQNFRVSDAYFDKASGLTIVYAQQTYKGVDVNNSVQTLAFKNEKLVSVAGSRIINMPEIVNSKDGKASVTAMQAVLATASDLKLAVAGSVQPLKAMTADKKIEFGDLGVSSMHITTKLVWVADDVTKKMNLGWQVAIQPKGVADLWLVHVDALRGSVMNKVNLNISCDWSHAKNPYTFFKASSTTDQQYADALKSAAASGTAKYGVIPFPAESPNHPGGTPSIQKNPWKLAGNGNNATTLQWNNDGTVTYDSTRGNNVLAQEDRNGNNGFGKGAVSTAALPNISLLFRPDFSKSPTVTSNQYFAITNLFYWNNIMHDISYQYGFDEAAGNFQANNQGRGGAGNDYVFADAQDGSGTNNANFSTPSDGSNPRMQMFLFDAVPTFAINAPSVLAGKKTATESAFSTNNKIANVGPITNDVVLFNDDATGTTHGACSAAFNASQLAGKIALIDRGTCSFTVKVKNAQDAGAVAALVVDNVPGEYPIVMGGTDNTITIPAFMVSYETGDSIKQAIAKNAAVNVTMSAGVQLDGDLDNGVISHEYTHGISNRLTGGPSNTGCLGNKEEMGEGWSDYMALMVTTNWAAATVNDGPNARPIGTYVLGQGTNGPGIRYYPYSSDMGVNPWTYDSMALSSRFSNGFLTYDPHVVGEVWCNMLWSMTWEISKQVGTLSPNLYNASANGGNTIALQLVITGMKLQPCSPGFVDGRDAILKADTLLYGGVHSKAIWHAFAMRGLGVNANENSTNNVKDGVADYTEPPMAAAATTVAQSAVLTNTGVSISPNPARTNVTLTVNGNNKQLSVEVIGATGKQLRAYTMKGSYLQMNVSGLQPGMYYVRITGEGIAETRKLIIQ